MLVFEEFIGRDSSGIGVWITASSVERTRHFLLVNSMGKLLCLFFRLPSSFNLAKVSFLRMTMVRLYSYDLGRGSKPRDRDRKDGLDRRKQSEI